MNSQEWIDKQAAGLPTYMGYGERIRKPHAVWTEDYNTVAVWCFPEGDKAGAPCIMHIRYKHSGSEVHHAGTAN